MRRALMLSIFLLWASIAGAQVNLNIPNGGNQATEEWVKQQIDSWLKRADTPPTTEEPPVDPGPEPNPCAVAPSIQSISNIGPTGIRAVVSGSGVAVPVVVQQPTQDPVIPDNGVAADFDNWGVGGWSGEVWKPKNYNTLKKYPVVYVHDAVTLYPQGGHPDGNWNLANRVQALIDAGTIGECIIVSISTPDRMRTLLPNKPFYSMPSNEQAVISQNNGGGPRADETINFMVTQLKPYIDANFSTKSDRMNTTVMGASMGGIFAIYAFSERNDVFGKMAALSPHYQGTLIGVNDELFTNDMVNYIQSSFPNASAGGMAYFDRGTTSLDQNYETPQNQVNTILANKGYNASNLKKLVFEGGGHTNTEWGEHVPGIFTFLVPKVITTTPDLPPVVTPTTTVNWFVYKMSAPALYLKQGNIPFTQTLNIAWTGDLPGGDYGLKIQNVDCEGTAVRAFVMPNTGGPVPCGSAPKITSINISSKTLLTFVWSGLNVPEVVWNIKQGSSTIRSGSFVPGSSQTQTITYPALGAGTYQLQLVGLSCATSNPPVSFTIQGDPVTSTSGRHIYMNLTGFGWDNTQANGIHPDWPPRIEAFVNMNYQGVNFKGIDGIRINIKWFEYEPSEGNFDDATLMKIVNYCNARGLRLAVTLVPYRREGDGLLPESQMNKLIDGSIWWFEGKSWPFHPKTYMPSMNSDAGRTKFRACARHMAAFLKQFPISDYISCVTAQTEEYQIVREENPLMMSGYGDIDIQKWASFSGGKPVSKPSSITGEDAIFNWQGTAAGKEWGDFQTEALRGFHAEFVRGVKEGGLRSAAMYAGIGAPSGAHNFSTRLDRMFSANTSDQPDIVYSSEGDAGSQSSKLMATDLNIGTFPGCEPAIEFDPDDITANQIRHPPYEVDLNGNWLWDYGSSFYRRGGKIIHFAMAFHPNKIYQLSEALYKLKTQFLDSNSGMTGIEQGTPINHTVFYYGLQEFRGQWGANGGGLNKQVKITLN